MTERWTRRRLLSAALASACAGLSGCSFFGDSSIKKAQARQFELQQPLPELPSNFNTASIVQYVAEHAQITTANEQLAENATNAQVTSVASLARQIENSFYLVVSVTGTVDFPNGATPRFGKTLFYYVDTTQTLWAEHTAVRDLDRYGSSSTGDIGDAGIELTNFQPNEQTLSVVVRDTSTDTNKTILDRSVVLPPTGGKSLSFIYKTGTYIVQILGENTNQQFRWQVTENSSSELWVYTSPAGRTRACGTAEENCRDTFERI